MKTMPSEVRIFCLRMLEVKYFCSLRSAFSPKVVAAYFQLRVIITPSGGKKMMVPGIQEAIFLRSIGVGDAMLDTVAEVVHVQNIGIIAINQQSWMQNSSHDSIPLFSTTRGR